MTKFEQPDYVSGQGLFVVPVLLYTLLAVCVGGPFVLTNILDSWTQDAYSGAWKDNEKRIAELPGGQVAWAYDYDPFGKGDVSPMAVQFADASTLKEYVMGLGYVQASFRKQITEEDARDRADSASRRSISCMQGSKFLAVLAAIGVVLSGILAFRKPRLSKYVGFETKPSSVARNQYIYAVLTTIVAFVCFPLYGIVFGSRDTSSIMDGLVMLDSDEAMLATKTVVSGVTAGAVGLCVVFLAISAFRQFRAVGIFKAKDPEIAVVQMIEEKLQRERYAASEISGKIKGMEDYIATLKATNVTVGLEEAERKLEEIKSSKSTSRLEPFAEEAKRIGAELVEKRKGKQTLVGKGAPEEVLDAIRKDIQGLRDALAEVGKRASAEYSAES